MFPDTDVHIGAHIIIPRGASPDYAAGLIRKIHAAGMTMVRVYPYWADVEQKRGVYDFAAVDACYRTAEELGVNIFHTFKPNSPPHWMRLTSSFNLHDIPDLDNPEIWEPLLAFVRATAERYKDSSALHSWCIWNEPRITLPIQNPSPHMLRAFREFLRRRYNGDIQAVNCRYFYQYESFDEICPEGCRIAPGEFKDYPERMDFIRFNVDMLTRKLREIGEVVHAVDPTRLQHVNPYVFLSNDMGQGGAVWREAEQVDFLGGSVYPAWNGSRYLATQHAFVCDMLRSATPGPERYYWITETQGGPAFYTANEPLCPDADLIRLWLWDIVGAGAKGMIYWSMTPTVRGEWALLNQDMEPSSRLRAVASECDVLRIHREIFAQARPAEPDVWVLNADTASQLDLVRGKPNDDGTPRSQRAHKEGVYGTWRVLSENGYEVGFCDERAVLDGKLPTDGVLIAPTCTALPGAVLQALRDWVEGGGRLIADGQFGWMAEDGLVSRTNKEILDDLFGARLLDFELAEGEDQCIVSTTDQSELPLWILKAIFAESAGTTHVHATGEPAVVSNACGSGRATRVGTILFQRYGRYPFDMGAFLAALLPEPSAPLRLSNGSADLRLRRLDGPTPVFTLVNYGPDTVAQLEAKTGLCLADIATGEILTLTAGQSQSLPMGKRTFRVFSTKTLNAER